MNSDAVTSGQSAPEVSDSKDLHHDALVIDICGTTDFSRPSLVIEGKNALDRAQEGGIDAVVVTIAAYDESFMKCATNIAAMLHYIDEHADRVCLAMGVDDVRAAKATGRLAIMFGLQTGSPVETDWLTTLPLLAKLGVRVMQATYNEQNRLGSGCLEPNDLGLTAYGRQVVSGMRHFGVLPDIAHAGLQTAADIIEFANGPVICSHANVARITKHPRNLSDDMLRRVADSGGLVGIAAWSPLNASSTDTAPTLSEYIDHVECALDIVGPDSVALGLDLNENAHALPGLSAYEIVYADKQSPAARWPQSVKGLDNLSHVPRITAELMNRGIEPRDIRKILGENFLRVMAEV